MTLKQKDYCLKTYQWKKDNKIALLKRLSEIEVTFLSKRNDVKYRFWFNMDGNLLDDDIMDEVVCSLSRINNHIYKIAFIGLGMIQKRKFEKLMKRYFIKESMLYHFLIF